MIAGDSGDEIWQPKKKPRALTHQHVRDNGGGEIYAGHLSLEILPSSRRVGSGDPIGVSTRWSWGCMKISLEKVIGGGLFQWWLWLLLSFAMTVMRPELTTQRNPNPNIPKLYYGSNTMLREKEYYILIHLQRRNIHIYTLVLGQKRKQS